MRTNLFFAVIAVCLPTLCAAQNFTPLNVKEGLWQMTLNQSGGMPGMSPDALAQMPPEARARMEEMMKQHGMSMNGNGITVKSCVTKDTLAKGSAFSEKKSNCTHTVVKSSASHMEFKMHCENKHGDETSTVEGTTLIDVVGSDSVKGTTHMVITSSSGSKTMDSTFASKYLGPDCGDIK
jgi:Protein of unknown function (DUF3617)